MKDAEHKKNNSNSRRHTLEEIQRAFEKAIRNPLDAQQHSRKLMQDGQSMQEVAEEFLLPNDRLTEFERLEIYNRQYWFRLIDCLYDDFPGLRALLGSDRFYSLAEAYLNKYPSRSFTLRNLGNKMVDFIAEEPKYCGRRFKIASEMARFEWAQTEAFDTKGWEPLDMSVIANTSPENLKLHLQPYITLLALNYPLDDFLIALRKEHSGRSEAGSEVAPERMHAPAALPKKAKVHLAVHRFQNSLYYKRLDKPAFILLSEIKNGASLGEACDTAFKNVPKRDATPEKAAALIHDWFTTWRELSWFGVPSSE